MVRIKNFIYDNDNIKILEQKGVFTVFQHNMDMSVTPNSASTSYFMSKTNCTLKQVAIELQDNAIRLKLVGRFLMVKSISAVKPNHSFVPGKYAVIFASPAFLATSLPFSIATTFGSLEEN